VIAFANGQRHIADTFRATSKEPHMPFELGD
jgi:hypothetical protein